MGERAMRWLAAQVGPSTGLALSFLGCSSAAAGAGDHERRLLEHLLRLECRVNGVEAVCDGVAQLQGDTAQALLGCSAPGLVSRHALLCPDEYQLVVETVRQYSCSRRVVDEWAFASCCPEGESLAGRTWAVPRPDDFVILRPSLEGDSPDDRRRFDHFVPVAGRAYSVEGSIPLNGPTERDYQMVGRRLWCSGASPDWGGSGTSDARNVDWRITGAMCPRFE